MKLLLINEVCGIGSTGKICVRIAEEYEKKGYKCKIAYGRDGNVPEQYREYAVRIGGSLSVRLHALKTRLFDAHGFGSYFATKRFLRWADKYDPDILWLHNLHGYYINIELLFRWIKSRPDMKVKWTLHDCWAFTGHCSHFTVARCGRWKKQCFDCPQKKEYPKSIVFDNSYYNYKRKKRAFKGVNDLTVITPSKWLAGLVKKSFLKEYKVEVQHNTINSSVFKPTESDFREKYGLKEKKIVLGVSNIWNGRKGYYDFIKLSKMLDDKYKIVLVGLSEKQLNEVPKSIIGISRTKDQKELAAIYTAADVFLNLTYEDNYPTVNLEAQACGTPVITYRTGGSPESVPDENVVNVGDISSVRERIGAILKC